MPLFGKKKDAKAPAKPKEEKVICPHCYVDMSVERVQEAGGACPSCKGKIDLEKAPRVSI